MRKFLLSAFVVLAFVFYSIHKHIEGNDAGLVLAPKLQPTPGPSASFDSGIKSGGSGSNVGILATPTPSATPAAVSNSPYRDGQYTGSSADAYYGNIQVQVTILGGKITDVVFLDYPHDRRTSVEINTQAMPYLKQEAIAAQNANVDIVSGATDSSRAFIQSLGSALAKAKI